MLLLSVDVSPQPSEVSLLPELKAEDQGKVCVVIDLDETLVHSSFKVHLPLVFSFFAFWMHFPS